MSALGLGASVGSVAGNISGIPNLIGETMGGVILPTAVAETVIGAGQHLYLDPNAPPPDPNEQLKKYGASKKGRHHHASMKAQHWHLQAEREKTDALRMEGADTTVHQQQKAAPMTVTKREELKVEQPKAKEAKVEQPKVEAKAEQKPATPQRKFAAAGPS